MDVLAICGSPRKNKTTHSLLEAVLAGTGRPYEVLWPADMKIGHCTGCQKCETDTPGKCWQDDDMTTAIEQMFEAKSLIIASPTYYGGVPGPLKNFIDRSTPAVYAGKGDPGFSHGNRPFKGIPSIFLAIAGHAGHEITADLLRLVLTFHECNIVGEYVEAMGGIVLNKEEYLDIYNELFALGKKMDEALSSSG